MKRYIVLILIILVAFELKAQYPFEQFDSVDYKTYDNWIKYDLLEKKDKIHFTLSINDFFSNHDTMTIQLTSYNANWDSSYIRIYRNKYEIQKIFEPMGFTGTNFWSPLIVADFNNDSLLDLKLNVAYMGCGLAAMNARIIYLFQTQDNQFIKISYLDKLENNNRVERDFNNDGNYEIITMTLNGYENHNYWTFDLFNYKNQNFVNVGDEFDYPIMIQFLLRKNYEITSNISREKMKDFKLISPELFDKQ